MQLIRAVKAFYKSFSIGCEPSAVECEIRHIEANGRQYLKTPFAMIDKYMEPEEMIDGSAYFATAEEAMADLNAIYPWWKQAEPIMEALHTYRHNRGELVGAGQLADKIDVSVDNLYKIARGAKCYTLKQVKDAVKLLGKPLVLSCLAILGAAR